MEKRALNEWRNIERNIEKHYMKGSKEKIDTDLKVLMHRVNESSIIDGNSSNEHVIYLL